MQPTAFIDPACYNIWIVAATQMFVLTSITWKLERGEYGFPGEKMQTSDWQPCEKINMNFEVPATGSHARK